MLVIRPEQLDRLEHIQRERFTEEMIAHVRRFYGEETLDETDLALRRLIQERIAQASTFGIETRRDVCDYLNLTFEFGDKLERLPWAAAILNDPWKQKARRLYEAGLAGIAGSVEGNG